MRTLVLTTALVLLASPVLADQAACEKTVRALLFPFEENKPETVLNRFGTSVTNINGTVQTGYSFQSPEGSVHYNDKKDPVSLSFSTGESYWTQDGGKTWTLVNPNSKEVMDEVFAGLRKQAEEATDIVCEYGVDLNGRSVNYYQAKYKIYNSGDNGYIQYWVDAKTGFVWRDVTHFTGSADVLIDVTAEPAPDMVLPEKPG